MNKKKVEESTEEPKKGIVDKVKEVFKKPALEKVMVSAKQIGKNLNIVVGNEKFTRVGEKEELTKVKDSIKLYDEKPTKKNFEEMMKLIKPETEKKAQEEIKVKAEIKATKKKVEEKTKEVKAKKIVVAEVVKEIDEKLMSDNELDEMQKAIDSQRAKKQPEARTALSPRSGESYRR